MDIDELTRRAKDNGKTVTPQRENVFNILRHEKKALTAYDIIDQFKTDVKPMTVYRALDFLTEMGAVHRIESLNAYTTCSESHCAHNDSQYMICTQCHAVQEIHNHTLDRQINDALAIEGFDAHKKSMEVLGHCRTCRT